MKERGDLFTATENRYTGYTVHDDAGEKIGEVEDSFVSENNHTEYIRIKTRTLELRSTLIPMNMAHVSEQRQLVEVSASRESVLDAPTFDDNDELTPQFERQVWNFFGVASSGMLEMPSDWLVPFLIICLRERDCYGHDLSQRMIDFGFRVAPPEAIYRVLLQMEKERIVVSKSFGLSRRRYSITELGEAYLEYLANVFEQYRAEIDLFFRLYYKHSAGELRSRHHSLDGEESKKHA
ncbi:MAG: hypothetical protein QOI57_1472 [Rubrobacteraceae bacterium]|nr:hypothetical protein [Rubrobacteraceae bacterium]